LLAVVLWSMLLAPNRTRLGNIRGRHQYRNHYCKRDWIDPIMLHALH